MGLAAGIFVATVLVKEHEKGGFESLGAMLFGAAVIGFLLALSVLGAVVEPVIRLVF